MSYIAHSFSLSENQKKKLTRAYNKNKAVNIKFKKMDYLATFLLW